MRRRIDGFSGQCEAQRVQGALRTMRHPSGAASPEAAIADEFDTNSREARRASLAKRAGLARMFIRTSTRSSLPGWRNVYGLWLRGTQPVPHGLCSLPAQCYLIKLQLAWARRVLGKSEEPFIPIS